MRHPSQLPAGEAYAPEHLSPRGPGPILRPAGATETFTGEASRHKLFTNPQARTTERDRVPKEHTSAPHVPPAGTLPQGPCNPVPLSWGCPHRPCHLFAPPLRHTARWHGRRGSLSPRLEHKLLKAHTGCSPFGTCKPGKKGRILESRLYDDGFQGIRVLFSTTVIVSMTA